MTFLTEVIKGFKSVIDYQSIGVAIAVFTIIGILCLLGITVLAVGSHYAHFIGKIVG